jgi:hypothetical protein
MNDMFNKTYIGDGTIKSTINQPGLPILTSASKMMNSMNSNNSLNKHKTTFEMSNRFEPIIIQSGNQNEDLVNVFKEELNRVALAKEDWANDLKVADEQAEK